MPVKSKNKKKYFIIFVRNDFIPKDPLCLYIKDVGPKGLPKSMKFKT